MYLILSQSQTVYVPLNVTRTSAHDRLRGCPITGIRFELFVIGYQRDSYVNHAPFLGYVS